MEAKRDCIIVTAADDKYRQSLSNMLLSLKEVPMPVVVLDLGLSAESQDQIQSVCTLDCTFIDPGWCVPLEHSESLPNYKKVFLAKPYLPELIPGYAKYLWIDADIWFQDASALEDYVSACETMGAAICYEDHPSYIKKGPGGFLRRLGFGKKAYKVRRMEQYFGAKVARQWGQGATLNSGIFCFKQSSDVWRHWQSTLLQANLEGHRKKRLICDQTCLDLAVKRAELRVAKMPATHNWCLGRSIPLSKGNPPVYSDPEPPHLPIKVLHATGSSTSSTEFINRATKRMAADG